MDLAELGIKDISLSGDSDQENSSDEEETLNKVPKTWKTEPVRRVVQAFI